MFMSSPQTAGTAETEVSRSTQEHSCQRGNLSRRQMRREAQREIGDVYLEYQEQMSQLEGGPIGCGYARYSSRFQDSIASQVRAALEHALELGIYIPLELIFFDVAVRGSKRNRDGLSQVEETLKSKRASTLLVLKTNRLFRKTYRCLQWIDLAVKRWKARLIFVKDNLDSLERGFDGIRLQMTAMLDEYGGRAHIDNVISQHIHLANQGIITGTVTFGYRGEEIPGQETRRGGLRRRWAIDDFEAEYVRKIYNWFVDDGLSRAEIVRRLVADPEAPLPPKSAGSWSPLAVNYLLANERYIGVFRYGERMNVDMPDADYLFRELRDEPLHVARYDELRIVEPEVWFEAQRLLDSKKSRGGRRRHATTESTGSDLVRGMFTCPEHCKTLWISGDAIICPECQRLPRNQRALASKLPVKLAVKMLLQAIIESVVQDREFLNQTYTAYVQSLECREQTDPEELQRLKVHVDNLGRRISSLKQDKGNTDLEIKESEVTLRELRMEREEFRSRVSRLEFEAEREVVIPDLDGMVDRLRQLGDQFLQAADSGDMQLLCRLRRVIELLLMDQIPLVQMGSREPRQGWLRAEFDVCIGRWLSGERSLDGFESIPTRRLTIDFKVPCPLDDEADEAYRLDKEERIPRSEIARRLGCGKSKVTRLLKHAYEKRNEEYVDGRTRRGQLNSATPPPVYHRIVERVMELYNDGELLQVIADDVGVCKDSITQVVRIWHEHNDMPLEDGRSRRKQLEVKNRPK